MGDKFTDGLFYLIIVADVPFFLLTIGKDKGGNSMIDADAGDGIQTDERAVVFYTVIIGTFHQHTLWKKVAYFQVSAYRGMQIAQ